jgi:hypothetical protein
MPRKKAAEPAANDGDETLTHPLFPHVPTAKIVGLVVKRLVVERRKGYPGHGAGDPPRVNLTPQAVPPSVIVGDETLAKDYGPGVYEVHAIGAGGRFAAGVPYRTKIPDETGHVPMYVDEFEDAPEDGDGVGGGVAVGAADAALAMRVQFLELQLKMQREVAADRERWALVQLEEQRKIFKLNTEGLSGLVENVIQANTGGRAAQDDPFVKAQLARAEKLERELEELRRETTRAQVKAASKTGGDEESGLAKMFFEHVAPELMSQVKESRELERKRLELEERRIRMVGESGTVIDGERIPALETVRDLVGRGKVPKGEGLEVFRRLHGRGMLPPAYVEVLKRWLSDDASAGHTAGASAGAGGAGGAVGG